MKLRHLTNEKAFQPIFIYQSFTEHVNFLRKKRSRSILYSFFVSGRNAESKRDIFNALFKCLLMVQKSLSILPAIISRELCLNSSEREVCPKKAFSQWSFSKRNQCLYNLDLGGRLVGRSVGRSVDMILELDKLYLVASNAFMRLKFAHFIQRDEHLHNRVSLKP